MKITYATYYDRDRDAINTALFENCCIEQRKTFYSTSFNDTLIIFSDNIKIRDSSKNYVPFNHKTKSMAGKPVPVEITVYKDKKFDFKIKSPPASYYIKEAVKLKGGSKEPGRNIVASISKKQLEDIAKEKMNDLNAHDINEAVKIIAGSARSMGIEVKE